ncbi:hypothetical protein ACRAWD_29285 [Caulobacter segnis]
MIEVLDPRGPGLTDEDDGPHLRTLLPRRRRHAPRHGRLRPGHPHRRAADPFRRFGGKLVIGGRRTGGVPAPDLAASPNPSEALPDRFRAPGIPRPPS